ncbi:MAG: Rieske 2Fe-2S domain-containing protein [Pirellulales bacterium]|nr:Rieske 2Fe-2S domain-containing protein [Pirellulales bacterium]
MRSKARIKNHPLHPMLIAFPIAFVTTAPIADLVGIWGGWREAWLIGAYSSLAAVVTGLFAAAPGLVDYFLVVPPQSSGKRRATWHMAINATALVAFAAGWAFRDWHTLQPQALAVALEIAGWALISVGGWLGGTLVYRNQIGIDHRYAEAGKWREVSIQAAPGEPVAVPGADQLKPGQMMLIHVGGRRIVLARTESAFRAFDDRCTHRGGSLAAGVLACDVVACPWHGSQFSVVDGKVQAGPATEPLSTYPVLESHGEIRIELASSS